MSNYILIFISSCLITYFVIKACGNLLNIEKIKLKPYLLIILFAGIIITYSLYNNGRYEHIIVSLVVVSFLSIVIYKQDVYKTIFSVMIYYLFMLVFEILLSVIVVNINNFNIDAFNTNSIFKSVFSIIDVLLAYFICLNKYIKNLVIKVTNNVLLLNTILTIVIISMILLDAKYLFSSTKEIYFGNIITLASLVYLLVFSLITDQKLIKENEKTEILLNFMTKYEKIIDDNRMFRHELLNNLLILKSYKNKNTKEFNNILDELIDLNSNKNISIKNIYNLPSGLKGIFYYKLYNLENNNYNISLNMSKKIGNLLNSISHKDYVNLYKVIGILLDNAIEACSKTKEKYLMIDIYQSDKYVYFDISNSFKGKIDLDKINSKGYSSKGKNRGIGLYVANSIISNNNNIEMFQSINENIFTSKLKVSL